ncbi:MAG: family FMN-dependent class oxidoreductase [Devosia sp.]|uniref:TIGR03885 family FMN-dependent LLM class oxidoreductase n=1 Tax=Devosia sp. TaxID=1871048 RepID=UPI0026135483|nr:TIGR03885 family FMN-dependent LLM class oxidoreductase [Devosia sp.]MDB5527418.1 family FMN-dependent class oxidoreductase [Devosia sp.]
MVQIGYHASHEQFAPSRLLALVKRAEAAGFHAAKSSDHFHPWSERQGQSGFAWSWLGAAMEATRFPMGIISAPGYRYHPAVLAQAAATIGEMYQGRLWLALGSGEAINEAITGEYWPEKAERNARLLECVNVMRRLFAGETVTHRGRITVVEAKLYTRPATPVPLYGAAVTAKTAALAGNWADGLLLAGSRAEGVRPLIEAFREGGGDGKPVHVQMAVSWAPTLMAAEENAVSQWPSAAIGGEVAWDLRRPADFDSASKAVTKEALGHAILITDSTTRIADEIDEIAAVGATAVHLHMVGQEQEAFIEEIGRSCILTGSGGQGC